MINNIDNQLEEYRDARRNAFVTALTIKSAGKHIAGIYGVNIPREILWALDIVPINIYSIDDSNISAAEELMDKEACSLVKASYGYIIKDKCPFTHFSDIIVGNDMCPKKLSMIKKLDNFKKLYIMPELNNVEALILKYRQFAVYLEQEFNLKINNTKLDSVIRKSNSISKKTQELLNLFMLNPNILGFDDLYSIIYGSQFILDLDERYNKITAITENLKIINNEQFLTDNAKLKRILIIGAPLAGLMEKILKPLSAMNCEVSAFAPSCCEGESYKLADEDKEPYTALAEKYLFIHPLENLSDLFSKVKIDAIINLNLKGCNTLCESYEFLDKPYLSITTDYSDNDTEKILKQINSFISNL